MKNRGEKINIVWQVSPDFFLSSLILNDTPCTNIWNYASPLVLYFYNVRRIVYRDTTKTYYLITNLIYIRTNNCEP